MSRIHVVVLICAAVLFGRPGMAADYELRLLTITARVPAKIQMIPKQPVNQPAYLNSEGTWKDLPIQKTGTGVEFSLPRDALGRCVVLLVRPEWLVLPDTDPPVARAIRLDTTPVKPGAEVMDVGHLAGTPTDITITVADKLNPIAADHIRILIDDKGLAAYGGSVRVNESENGRYADIVIAPGNLQRAKHALVVRVPDATPTRNTLTLQLSFDTIPLVKNGDFEEVAGDGTAKHWYSDAWSLSQDTKYEFSAARGAGRSGNALKITGIAGSCSLLARQQPPLVPGKTYVFSGYYKSDATNAGVLLYALADGKNIQHEGEQFPPVEEWTAFEWEFTMKGGANRIYIYLRSSGHGTTYYDDVELELKE